MAVRSEKLGGKNLEYNDAAVSEDWNDTFDATIDFAANFAVKGLAQVPYTTLKATGEWENEGHLAADRFTTESGVKDTVNNADRVSYVDDSYISPYAFVAGEDILYDPREFEDPENAFDFDESTYAERTSGSDIASVDITKFGEEFESERFIHILFINAYFERVASRGGSGEHYHSAKIEIKKNGEWEDAQELFYEETTDVSEFTINDGFKINETIEGYRISSTSKVNRGGAVSPHQRIRIYQLENFPQYSPEGTILIGQNTLSLDSNNVASIYTNSIIPESTTIHAIVSDGTLETDEFELKENASTVIPLLNDMEGEMQIKFILRTTDETKTPELYGYGIYIY